MLLKRECVSPLGSAILTTGIPERKRLKASRGKLCELAGKIEEVFGELERASKEYEFGT